jgi:hypothetical protein
MRQNHRLALAPALAIVLAALAVWSAVHDHRSPAAATQSVGPCIQLAFVSPPAQVCLVCLMGNQQAPIIEPSPIHDLAPKPIPSPIVTAVLPEDLFRSPRTSRAPPVHSHHSA